MDSASSIYGHFCRVLSLLLALHFFNLSIDPPDPHPNSVPEDLSINEMESIVELIMEGLFGLDDLIEEHDDNDDEPCFLDFGGVYFVKQQHLLSDNAIPCVAGDDFLEVDERMIYSISFKINSPPPEV